MVGRGPWLFRLCCALADTVFCGVVTLTRSWLAIFSVILKEWILNLLTLVENPVIKAAELLWLFEHNKFLERLEKKKPAGLVF